MAVVTSPSREISSSEPLKNENASVPQRENRAGVPSPGAVKLKEEPWTSCQEVTVSSPSSLERASWFSSNGVVLFRHSPATVSSRPA